MENATIRLENNSYAQEALGRKSKGDNGGRGTLLYLSWWPIFHISLVEIDRKKGCLLSAQIVSFLESLCSFH